ncbi:MAG: murein biosynthesis integral membrane protein MurJ [Spirochaetales bacterium]|nr:murein biosynthesis integral membrane protein MurJ [Spirochaetales bacterium]
MKESTKRESTLATYIVMACTLASRLLGFVREALINHFFGAGSSADVLRAIFNFPNNMRKLLAEGALSSAFIPELSRQLVEDESGKKAKSLTASILGLLLLITIPLTLLFIIFPGAAVNILTDFKDPAQTELGTRLMPLLISYIFFVSISALLMGVLNSHKRFFVPAITPVFFSISVISSVLLFHDRLGIFSMAMGVIGGGIGQILIQIPSFRKLGYSLKPSLSFKSEEFRRVMVSWGPILLTSSIFSVNQIIAQRFASMLEVGSISAMNNAIIFWQLPFGLFVNSLLTVIYPKMSRQVAAGDMDGLGESLIYGWRGLMAMLLPSAAVFMTIGAPIIAVAMQRGEFTSHNTLMAAEVLFAYSTGLLFVGAYNFSQRAFYALGDYKTPIKVSLVLVAVDILFSVLFLFVWKVGVSGLAYANTIAYFAGLFIYFFVIQKRVTLSGGRKLLITLGKVFAALAAGLLWLWFMNRLWGNEWWTGGYSFRALGILMFYGLGYVVVVLGAYHLLKVEFLSIMRRKG